MVMRLLCLPQTLPSYACGKTLKFACAFVSPDNSGMFSYKRWKCVIMIVKTCEYTFPMCLKANSLFTVVNWVESSRWTVRVKSLRGRGSCHSTCHRYVRLPVAAAIRPATAKCACHRTCHRYVRLPLYLPPPNAPATGPATAMCACHHQMRLPPDLPQLCEPATRQQARS